MKVSAYIPARMASTRFPGKPLAPICGKPMIEHVYRRTRQSPLVNSVYIATCDQEIMAAAKAFGGEAVMTSDAHQRCTDRVAEAYRNVGDDADIVVVVQGDEPMLRPEMLDLALGPMLAPDGRDIFCTNLAARITSEDDANDPNEVKVVFDLRWNALYFSREPIPSVKKERHANWWKQVCVIPFWKETLERFNAMASTPLEQAESVDLMRVLEHGYTIRIVESPYASYSVDTEADRVRVELALDSVSA